MGIVGRRIKSKSPDAWFLLFVGRAVTKKIIFTTVAITTGIRITNVGRFVKLSPFLIRDVRAQIRIVSTGRG